MKTKQEILNALEAHKAAICAKFGVREIGLFGSYATGNAQSTSDIDILVDLEEPTFDRYMDLKFFLEDLYGTPVDLVLKGNVKPRLRPTIQREVVYA